MRTRTCVIVNPTAGRGLAARVLPSIREALAAVGVTEITCTASSGEEEVLAHAAALAGTRLVVAVGGDGTCARIANGIIKSGCACSLAVIPCGTGNDFAKTLGVNEYSPEQIAKLLSMNAIATIDVGRVDGLYFVNGCGFGFDPAVLDASTRVAFLKGDAVYIYSALRQLFSYRGIQVSRSNSVSRRPDPMLMVTASNGRSLGGAFQIAPHASVLDGHLDVAYFRDSNVLERVRLFAAAVRGTHLDMASVSSERTSNLSLHFSTPPTMEVDGELRRADSTTVKLECIPRALSVVAAPGALA